MPSDSLKKIWKFFYKLTFFIGAFFLIYYFLLQPNRVIGRDPIDPFIISQITFSERISYLFRDPQEGEIVIFYPTGTNGVINDNAFFGKIIKIEEKDNIKTYQIVSTKTQKMPWEVTHDKIISRVYYPQLRNGQ